MFEVKKIGEDVWVAMEEEKGAVEGEGEKGDMSDEEWDKLEEKMEADAISWWV
jgi:hypothetical protein